MRSDAEWIQEVIRELAQEDTPVARRAVELIRHLVHDAERLENDLYQELTWGRE